MGNEQILLSVIVPIYNAENHLKNCIDSIIKQTFSDYDILLIDDGSIDRSYQIAQEYQKKYPDIITAMTHSNCGVAQTRNLGIQLARGKYVAFIDNDDTIREDYFEKLIYAAEANDAEIAACGFDRVNSQGEVLYSRRLGFHTTEKERWALWRISAPWAKVYSRDFLVNNQILFYDSKMGEDIYFNIIAFSLCNKYVTINYSGYNYLDNTLSVSNTFQTMESDQASPCPMLMDGFRKICVIGKNRIQYVEYFYIRYIVWYIFFRAKHVGSSIALKNYDEAMGLLKTLFPSHMKNSLLRPCKPTEEEIHIRLFVWFIMIMKQIGMSRWIIKVYAWKNGE